MRTDALRRMVAELPDGLKGTRDRALLSLGFTACRRSELAALDLEDVEETDKGLTVLLRRSKTDQAGEGREVAVLYGAHPDSCPVRSLRAWIAAAWALRPVRSSCRYVAAGSSQASGSPTGTSPVW